MSGFGICTRRGIVHSWWGLSNSVGNWTVSWDNTKHRSCGCALVDLWISQTSILAFRGRYFASDCRINKTKLNGQSAPKMQPVSLVQDNDASPRTRPLSSLTIECPFVFALGLCLIATEGSIWGRKSTYNGSEVISSSLSETCTNARSTHSVWTKLRWGGRVGGKLTIGHLIANKNVWPTPLVGRNTFRLVEDSSVSVNPFLAVAFPFEGAASHSISWIEKSWVSVGFSTTDFVVPSNMIPTFDIFIARLSSNIAWPVVNISAFSWELFIATLHDAPGAEYDVLGSGKVLDMERSYRRNVSTQ